MSSVPQLRRGAVNAHDAPAQPHLALAAQVEARAVQFPAAILGLIG